MKIKLLSLFIFSCSLSFAQSFAPPAGQVGTTAIHRDSSVFVNWATGAEIHRGFVNISDTNYQYNGDNHASFGNVEDVLGQASADPTKSVSLGDSGWAILTFDKPIINGEGWDFAVFENGHSDDFLELGFVEVSSDGIHYFRFPAVTEIPSDQQITPFGTMDCRYFKNFAGKYRVGFGTPFDLEELPEDEFLDKNDIRYVKVLDVVGSINPLYATHDSQGNIVNDPFPTAFHTSGFDLTGVGVIHQKETTATSDFTTEQTKIYPTVTSNFLTVEAAADFDFSVLDLEGKQLFFGSMKSGKRTLPVNELKVGPYLLLIHTKTTQETFRFVKR